MINRIKSLAKDVTELYVRPLRHQLHRNPELSFVEYETSQLIHDVLDSWGIENVSMNVTGVVATIKGRNPEKRTIALRADIDALPIQETNDCDYKSLRQNVMHACGHDMHTAMLLGAAKLLQQNKDQIKGTVKLVFQPNEEGFKGAKNMLKAGVLKNPDVDAAMALHVHSGTPSNIVLCGLGTSIAGCNRFRIVVKGTGAHGAMPELGVDPINIAAHIYLSIQAITSREITATKPAVVTNGKFSGETAANIIPDEVIMEGTIRSLDKENGEFIFNRMKDIIESTAKMFRGEAELIELSSVPPLANDDDLVKDVTSYLKDLLGEQSVVVFNQGGMGSEDFASYSYEVPSIYLMLGAGTKQENPQYGEAMHNPKVVFNEDILVTGTAMHTYSAIMWLKNH